MREDTYDYNYISATNTEKLGMNVHSHGMVTNLFRSIYVPGCLECHDLGIGARWKMLIKKAVIEYPSMRRAVPHITMRSAQN